MIGPFMTRVCSGLKVPHTLLQVETEEGPDPPLPQQYAYLPPEVQTFGKGHFPLVTMERLVRLTPSSIGLPLFRAALPL